MAISITITDAQDSHTFTMISAPLVVTPVIRQTDVETIDGNISTYYGSTKREIKVSFGYMEADEFDILLGFQTRQFQNLKYPTITINDAPGLEISAMTAKITVSSRQIENNCGLVRQASATFRESKQMA